MASICYVVASYYHLKFDNNWSFITALSIAAPVVLVEYLFSLHGNHFLSKNHGYDPIEILIITIVFYFVNLWLMNVLVLKKQIKHVERELLAFSLVLIAFGITAIIR